MTVIICGDCNQTMNQTNNTVTITQATGGVSYQSYIYECPTCKKQSLVPSEVAGRTSACDVVKYGHCSQCDHPCKEYFDSIDTAVVISTDHDWYGETVKIVDIETVHNLPIIYEAQAPNTQEEYFVDSDLALPDDPRSIEAKQHSR